MSKPMTLLAAATMIAAISVVAVAPAALAQVVAQARPKAAAPTTPRLGNPRLYLIWLNTGAMSQDMAGRKDQIIANDRKLGASVQARLDAVVEAPPGQHDDLMLTIRVTSDGKPIIDESFPVGYMDTGGRMYRAVIVNHDCQPFEVEMTLGSAQRTLKVDLTCGG